MGLPSYSVMSLKTGSSCLSVLPSSAFLVVPSPVHMVDATAPRVTSSHNCIQNQCGRVGVPVLVTFIKE